MMMPLRYHEEDVLQVVVAASGYRARIMVFPALLNIAEGAGGVLMLMGWQQSNLLITFACKVTNKSDCVTPVSDKPGVNP